MMDFKIEYVTINNRLQMLAKEDPDKAAFIFFDDDLKRTVLTRQDIWDKSRKCAAFFRRLGIAKGDVVCNTLANSQERLITTYGVILAGAVSMHGQKFLADGEDLIKNLYDSQCKAIIIDPDEENGPCKFLDKLKYTEDQTGRVGFKDLPYLTQVITVALGNNNGCTSWLESLDQEQDLYVDETVTGDDLAAVMCTSGSTGFAKLVPRSHKSLKVLVDQAAEVQQLKHDSKYFNHRSFGWVGGFPMCYPFIGMTRLLLILTPGKRLNTGELITHVLENEECDSAWIVPSDIQPILDHLDSSKSYKIQKLLQVIATGGSPISKITLEAIGRVSESLAILYGSTEIGYAFYLNVIDTSEYEDACCGYPTINGNAKIVDKSLMEVAHGKFGEVLYRGKSVFSGYLNNPTANKEVILEDGWFRTSDIGHKNEKGQMFVHCRQSNAINHKGIIHYPGWMEARVDSHPDIKKSIILGIPDPVVHEQICVCIIKTGKSMITIEDIKEYFKSLFLTSETSDITPIPKHYLFFDAFPLNENGKIDRHGLKKLAVKRIEAECNA